MVDVMILSNEEFQLCIQSYKSSASEVIWPAGSSIDILSRSYMDHVFLHDDWWEFVLSSLL